MKKAIKVLSCLVILALCIQVLSPGIMAINETPLIGNNAAVSASKGTSLSSANANNALAELDAEAQEKESLVNENTEYALAEIIGEFENYRSENTKHFRHQDGTYTAAVYSEPVHYKDSNGKWKDIDNRLILNDKKLSSSGKSTYTPKASSLDIRIPQDFSESQKITIKKNGYTIGMGVLDSSHHDFSKSKAVINNDYTSDNDKITVKNENENFSFEEQTTQEKNIQKMELKNQISSVEYSNVFKGTDLQYIISSGKIKENIVINSKREEYIYKFELDLGGLFPVKQENGSINLYKNAEDTEPVFKLETPYMYDARESTSFDVSMELKGSTLIIHADEKWINSEGRAFPVIIDPTFSANSSTYYDATVCYGASLMNFDTYKYLYAGNGVLSLRRIYFKFNVPSLPDGSVITNANLNLIQHDIDQWNSNMYLYAFDLTGQPTWSESNITWRNQPLSKDKNGPQKDSSIRKIDYFKYIDSSSSVRYYNFDLTNVVKDWYEGKTNNGIMIASSDEKRDSQATIYSSDYSNSDMHPLATISYTNAIGVDNQYSYEAFDTGRQSVAYINRFNGSLTYIHNDISMSGNRLPLNISHVYNSNSDINYSTYYPEMYVGKNFHLNLQELLIPIENTTSLYASGYRFKYYDGDGSAHYLKTQSINNVTKTVMEFDPTTYVTLDSNGTILNFADGIKKFFYNDGRMYKITDKNGNTQLITFSGNKISQVTDPAGRTVTFRYNDNNQLTGIVDPANRSKTYGFSSTGTTANITSILYSDNKFISLTYSNSILSNIYSIDSSYIKMTNQSLSYKGKRITSVSAYDKNGALTNKVTLSFLSTDTQGNYSSNVIVSDSFDKTKTYIFDKYGRAVSVTDQDNCTQYSIYNSDAINQTDEFNKLQAISEPQIIAKNLIKNHGFEREDYWTKMQTAFTSQTGFCGYTDEKSSLGYRSLKLELIENNFTYEVDQDFYASAGKAYTISLDIYIPDKLNVSGNNGVAFGFVYCVDGHWYTQSSDWISSTSGWEHYTKTLEIPSGTLTNCHVFVELVRTTGTVYFDNVQVEESEGSCNYNLIENCTFFSETGVNEEGASAYGWREAETEESDGIYTASGNNNFRLYGNPENSKRIIQTIPANVAAGETVVIGGKAFATMGCSEDSNQRFMIHAELIDNNNVCIELIQIHFDPHIINDYQTRAATVKLSRNCKYINYCLVYSYQLGEVYFNSPFIYLNKFGEHYEYGDEGLLKSCYNDEGKTIEYDYVTSTNNVSQINQTVSGDTKTVADYTYDSNNINVVSTTNNYGTAIDYTYGNNGEILSQSISGSDESITEYYSYIQDGNYIKTFTDSTGGVTTYTYDNNDQALKGLITSVTDPKGNTTNYTYDPNNDDLLSVSGNSSPSQSVITSISTMNDLPVSITHNNTVYSYTYNGLNQVVSSAVGNQNLVTFDYNTKNLLSSQTYSNGNIYSVVYDNRDRVSGRLWNNSQIVSYYYNNENRLSRFTDNTTGITYQYEYAFYDMPNRIESSDGNKTAYNYDSAGNLSDLIFSNRNDTLYKEKFLINESGKPEDIIISAPVETLIHYNYDELGRLTGFSYGSVISSVGYVSNGSGTTERVDSYSNEDRSGNMLNCFNYSYDLNGNITGVNDSVLNSVSSYSYDGLNRLVSESSNGNNYLYSYDAGGNITSVFKNGVTEHTFAYDNYNWKDQLTSFDGCPITYDALGNPVTYNGYTYSWQRAAQLSGISGNGVTASYTYDAMNRRISKEVNGVATTYIYSGNLLIRQISGENIIDFIYDASSVPLGFVYNGNAYWYVKNIQGDVISVLDDEGTVCAQYSYDAYGNIVSSSGPISSINPVRYRGYYYDTETGLYYLKSRYYSPLWHRFINADSIFVAGNALTACNMYAYCNNNPIMYIDSNGHYGAKIDSIIWFWAKEAEYYLEPLSIFFSSISDSIYDNIVEKFDDISLKFDVSNLIDRVRPMFNNVTDKIFSLLNPIDVIDKRGAGLRNLFSNNLSFGAKWAETFLGFETPNDNLNVRRSVHEKTMWQSLVGYSPIYDFFFSLGGPIKRDRYEFQCDKNGKITYYAIWIWKGDYWNLGAGAEIGVYSNDNASAVSKHFYNVDPSIELNVHLEIWYASTRIDAFSDRNWWICSFCPNVQQPQINFLKVYYKANFFNYDLQRAFYNKFYSNPYGEFGTRIDFSATPSTDPNYPLFEIEF